MRLKREHQPQKSSAHVTRPIVSAVIPLFNEEKNAATVLSLLTTHPLIDEVICINDGSTDKTKHVLTTFADKVSVITLKKNHGKGYAMASGVKVAKGNIITFFDADLIGLTNRHIETLITPILHGKADVVIGHKIKRKNQLVYTLFKSFAGERAYYRKDLLPHLSNMKQSRFGVETYLNNVFEKKYYRVKKVPLYNLSHLLKHQKYTRSQAFKETLKEVVEIAQTMGNQEIQPTERFAKYLPVSLIKVIYRNRFYSPASFVLLAVLIMYLTTISFTSPQALTKTAKNELTRVLTIESDLSLTSLTEKITPYLPQSFVQSQ